MCSLSKLRVAAGHQCPRPSSEPQEHAVGGASTTRASCWIDELRQRDDASVRRLRAAPQMPVSRPFVGGRRNVEVKDQIGTGPMTASSASSTLADDQDLARTRASRARSSA